MTENELRDLRELFREVPLITRAESRKVVHKLLDEIDRLRVMVEHQETEKDMLKANARLELEERKKS